MSLSCLKGNNNDKKESRLNCGKLTNHDNKLNIVSLKLPNVYYRTFIIQILYQVLECTVLLND